MREKEREREVDGELRGRSVTEKGENHQYICVCVWVGVWRNKGRDHSRANAEKNIERCRGEGTD